MNTLIEVPGTEKSEKEVVETLNSKLVIGLETLKKRGKKIITVVKGFNYFKPEETSNKDYINKLKNFIKFIKNKKGCAGAFLKDEKKNVTFDIMFQGDCVDLCYEYVLKNKMIPKDKIEKKGL